jgi:hypothetical protein
MDRTYLHAGRILTLLALYREIDISSLRDQRRVVVMFGFFKILKISSLEPCDPDPMQLAIVARVVIFLYTGVHTSSAPNAP